MKKAKKESVIAAGAIILLIMSLVWTGYLYNSNRALTGSLIKEMLESEQAMNESRGFLGDIERFKTQINSLNGQNRDLESFLKESMVKINLKEAEITKLWEAKSSTQKLRKELAELNGMRRDFETNASEMKEAIKKLNQEKELLAGTIATLKDQNKELATNLEILSSLTADNYLVETTKKRDKLTVMAKRTRKMKVSFKVPDNVVENISFRITTPAGTKIDGKDKGLVYKVVNDEDELMASTSTDKINVTRKVEMTYEAKEKLKGGVYRIEMYNAAKYIGSCNVKLR